MIESDLQEKYTYLLELLGKMEGAVIGFSGGVDSSFLLHSAYKVLGDKVLAVTLSTSYVPNWEMEEAQLLARLFGVKHKIVSVDFPEEIRNNPPDRCYICKKFLFTRLKEIAVEEGLSHVLDGTNVDDLGDYRPGLKALAELAIDSPLSNAGLTKQDIRTLSKELGISTWNKPSFACLMSRIPYETMVTDKELKRIEAAEVYLMGLGFEAVRVRSHGDIARIEVPAEHISRLVEAGKEHAITDTLKELGYSFVTVDLSGYTMGSLNDGVMGKDKNET